jgi:molybdopterin molybdotransferase
MIAAIAPMVGEEIVGLRDALGRVLARDVHSPLDVPAHRNSAMDGYALAGSDLPPQGHALLEVVGTSWAGRPYVGALASGSVCAS